jgi:hypothetical protein
MKLRSLWFLLWKSKLQLFHCPDCQMSRITLQMSHSKSEGRVYFNHKPFYTLIVREQFSMCGLKHIVLKSALKWLSGRNLGRVVPEEPLLDHGGPLLVVLMTFTVPGRTLVVLRKPCSSWVFLWVLDNPCGPEGPLLVIITCKGRSCLYLNCMQITLLRKEIHHCLQLSHCSAITTLASYLFPGYDDP